MSRKPTAKKTVLVKSPRGKESYETPKAAAVKVARGWTMVGDGEQTEEAAEQAAEAPDASAPAEEPETEKAAAVKSSAKKKATKKSAKKV